MEAQHDTLDEVTGLYNVLIIGSGVDFLGGLKPYYDYYPYRYCNEQCELSSLICSELGKELLEAYTCVKKLLEKEVFSSVIVVSPYCVHRCLVEEDERIIELLGCVRCSDCKGDKHDNVVGLGGKIDYKKLIRVISEIMIADNIFVVGITCELYPINMLFEAVKYGKARTIVVSTSRNVLVEYSDKWVRRSPIKWLYELCFSI